MPPNTVLWVPILFPLSFRTFTSSVFTILLPRFLLYLLAFCSFCLQPLTSHRLVSSSAFSSTTSPPLECTFFRVDFASVIVHVHPVWFPHLTCVRRLTTFSALARTAISHHPLQLILFLSPYPIPLTRLAVTAARQPSRKQLRPMLSLSWLTHLHTSVFRPVSCSLSKSPLTLHFRPVLGPEIS